MPWFIASRSPATEIGQTPFGQTWVCVRDEDLTNPTLYMRWHRDGETTSSDGGIIYYALMHERRYHQKTGVPFPVDDTVAALHREFRCVPVSLVWRD